MAISKIFLISISFLIFSGSSALLAADGQRERAELRVAVASNFLPTLRELGALYQTESGERIKIISASTGKLYAQIIHGAPFDIFLSADSRRPALLSKSGHAVKSSRFTYALGKVVLWSTQNIDDCYGALVEGKFRRLAIANPKTAPYGLAAQQVLGQMGLWETTRSRLVRGENIAQALHYVESGNAQLGIIALSLVRSRVGCIWEIPTNLYQPIAQQAVLLKRSAKRAAAERFLAFLRTPRAQDLIRSSGYGVE